MKPSTVLACLAVSVLALVQLASCQGTTATCTIYVNGTAQTPDQKTCSNCWWWAITYFDVNLVEFVGTNSTPAYSLDRDGMAAFDVHGECIADGRFDNCSRSVCVLLNSSGTIIDTQQQSCQECVHQCKYWADCASIVWNGQAVAKADLETALTCPFCPPPSPAPCTNAYELLTAVPGFTLLKAAIDYAGLASTVNDASFAATIFAPDDSRWAALGITTAAQIEALPVATVQSILGYHVLPGAALTTTQLVAAGTLPTLEGNPLYFAAPSVPGEALYVCDTPACNQNQADATVLTSAFNAAACAAMVQVVTDVLVPPGVTLP